MDNDTQVFILGAGCSLCGGYPLAKDVPAGLEEFSRSLDTSSANIKRCVENTIQLMKKNEVSTIDQLAQFYSGSDRQILADAKIAMSAHFLSIEQTACDKAYESYSAFFEDLLTFGNERSIEAKLKNTPCRVLTFNYDRLFERTFLKWVKRYEPQNVSHEGRGLHQSLNNGMNDIVDVRVHTDRFAFLKLHGGIGQSHRDNDGGFRYPYWPELDKDVPEIRDDNYFSRKGYERDAPLIIFPAEKPAQLHENEFKKWSFFRYSSSIWQAAQSICEQATEIRLLGYSIQFVDRLHFKEYLIKPAIKCQRITIENVPSSRREIERTLKTIRSELGASWQIEFEESRFPSAS